MIIPDDAEYKKLWFEMEENMRSSALFVAEYIFSDKMVSRLEELVKKYNYKVIHVHMDASPETAYGRFMERNAQSTTGKGIRSMELTFEKHEQSRRNQCFLGNRFLWGCFLPFFHGTNIFSFSVA